MTLAKTLPTIYAQEGDAPIIVAVYTVTLVFVESDNLGISHVLRYGSFLPALT